MLLKQVLPEALHEVAARIRVHLRFDNPHAAEGCFGKGHGVKNFVFAGAKVGKIFCFAGQEKTLPLQPEIKLLTNKKNKKS
jgi:hypothetical protein